MMPGLILSACAMTLIVAVRYLVTSGAFALWTARKFPRRLAGQRAQVRREIGWSLASAAIYGVPAGVVAWGWQNRGWTRIYTGAHDYPLWWLPASVVVYLGLHDTWFYWTHRWMHRPRLFRLAHAVHHASRPPTAWAAMSFHPWEAFTGAVVIPALVLSIPIHVAALATVLSIMTLMGITNHMGWEMFPRFIVQGRAGRWLITASHHELHHQQYQGNFGLYFRVWDRLCETDRGLGRFAAGGRGAGRDERAGGDAAGDDRGPARPQGDAAVLPDAQPRLYEVRR